MKFGSRKSLSVRREILAREILPEDFEVDNRPIPNYMYQTEEDVEREENEMIEAYCLIYWKD